MIASPLNPHEPALNPVPRLGLSLDEAARAIGLSRRSLDDLITDPGRGFPVVRIGRRVIVPTDQLREWLRNQSLTPAHTG